MSEYHASRHTYSVKIVRLLLSERNNEVLYSKINP